MNAISHIPMKHDMTKKYNREKTCELLLSINNQQ